LRTLPELSLFVAIVQLTATFTCGGLTKNEESTDHARGILRAGQSILFFAVWFAKQMAVQLGFAIQDNPDHSENGTEN
jgi:hypothetical protein